MDASINGHGCIEEHYIDDDTGDVLELITHDVQDIIDHNGNLRNIGDGGWSQGRLFRRIGSVPLALAHKWKVEEGIDVLNKGHLPDVVKRINDPDYSKLRTK